MLLVVTVDGQLHAVDRNEIIWSISLLDSNENVVQSSVPNIIIEPTSNGDLYTLNSDSSYVVIIHYEELCFLSRN